MRNIIFGTDWHTDCDDAVAMRILARAHKNHEINLLGAIINSCSKNAVKSLDGFLSKEGVNVPIGIDTNATYYGGDARYQDRLANFATHYSSNDDAEDGVKLYRKLIANSPSSVEIVEVGFLHIITEVLKSAPDEITPLDGISLFKSKVDKVWVMGGKWDTENGKEWNFSHTQYACKASSDFCKLCPVPVTFLGFEIGVNVMTPLPENENDHLRLAMLDYGATNGRPSWDPLTAILAIVGDENNAGYNYITGTASVNANTGENSFVKSDNGRHKIIVKRFSNDFYENEITKRIN